MVMIILLKRKIVLDYIVVYKLKIIYLYLIFVLNVVFFYKLLIVRIYNFCDKGILKRLEEKKVNGSIDNFL